MTTYMFCNDVVVFGDCYLVYGVTGLRVLHGVGVICHRLDSTCILLKTHILAANVFHLCRNVVWL